MAAQTFILAGDVHAMIVGATEALHPRSETAQMERALVVVNDAVSLCE